MGTRLDPIRGQPERGGRITGTTMAMTLEEPDKGARLLWSSSCIIHSQADIIGWSWAQGQECRSEPMRARMARVRTPIARTRFALGGYDRPSNGLYGDDHVDRAPKMKMVSILRRRSDPPSFSPLGAGRDRGVCGSPRGCRVQSASDLHAAWPYIISTASWDFGTLHGPDVPRQKAPSRQERPDCFLREND